MGVGKLSPSVRIKVFQAFNFLSRLRQTAANCGKRIEIPACSWGDIGGDKSGDGAEGVSPDKKR